MHSFLQGRTFALSKKTMQMKTLFNYPLSIYVVAGIASLGIMMLVDFILGPEAEHLNAWAIVNKLVGQDSGIPDSLAIRKFGLMGATLAMLALNFLFGAILVNLVKGFIHLVHAMH